LNRRRLSLRGDDDTFGEARKVETYLKDARLAGSELEREISRNERGAREGNVVAARRQRERVAAIVFGCGVVFLLASSSFGFGADMDAGYGGTARVEQRSREVRWRRTGLRLS